MLKLPPVTFMLNLFKVIGYFYKIQYIIRSVSAIHNFIISKFINLVNHFRPTCNRPYIPMIELVQPNLMVLTL